jgi:hypothetical protein
MPNIVDMEGTSWTEAAGGVLSATCSGSDQLCLVVMVWWDLFAGADTGWGITINSASFDETSNPSTTILNNTARMAAVFLTDSNPGAYEISGGTAGAATEDGVIFAITFNDIDPTDPFDGPLQTSEGTSSGRTLSFPLGNSGFDWWIIGAGVSADGDPHVEGPLTTNSGQTEVLPFDTGRLYATLSTEAASLGGNTMGYTKGGSTEFMIVIGPNDVLPPGGAVVIQPQIFVMT